MILESSDQLVYPALTDLATFVLVLGAGIPLVYFISKALKLRPQTLIFSEKKKQVVLSLIVFVLCLQERLGFMGSTIECGFVLP